MNLKLLSLLIIFIFPPVQYYAQEELIRLKDGWKFKVGDSNNFTDPEYSKLNYTDSDWNDISIDKIWEEQGYDPLDGFAWYRIKVFIPSSLKQNAYLKDSLKIFLGKVNNFDHTFLNGKIIGINGFNVKTDHKIDSTFLNAETILWDKNRRYTLPTDDPRILWDNINIIAVRVFDQGGQGGIYTGNGSVSMTNVTEYLFTNSATTEFEFSGDSITKNFYIKNISDRLKLAGTFEINAVDKTDGNNLFVKNEPVELNPGDNKNFSYTLSNILKPVKVQYDFRFTGTKEIFSFTEEVPYILTPVPPKHPRINGAKIYGQSPGRPFLYTVAVTGERPVKFKAANLPEGLSIDENTGIINGVVRKTGQYTINVEVANKYGSAGAEIKFIIGEKLALTPPMGWNSWNVWGLAVDQQKVLESARVFKEKLINHGWTFINVDDGWEIKGDSPLPKRDSNGFILTNEKFPDMKALADSIHAMGLKLGIYSSPGPLTCGGYTASYQHELQDAQSFASWGIDYLKYDWCSYDQIAKDKSIPELKKPYFVMRDALKQINRDIVYSLCQYGMGKVWEWGAEVGGNLWRTTGDITDTWKSMSEIGFNQIENAKYAGPGQWNDPDMLVVGWVGWGPNLHPTKLTPDEQYTHISLWSLLSAPLLIGCDLSRADPFTMNLLTNDEVLSVNQDPLGKQAVPVLKEGNIQVWIKELADGNKAVGIFNLGDSTEQFELDLLRTGLNENVRIRDVWRQKEIPHKGEKILFGVPSHGCYLIKSDSL